MPTFHAPKPTRNGSGIKEPLPTMQKEGKGMPRNILYLFLIGISDGPGFRVVGTKIHIRLNRKPRTANIVVNSTYSKVAAKMVGISASRGLQS